MLVMVLVDIMVRLQQEFFEVGWVKLVKYKEWNNKNKNKNGWKLVILDVKIYVNGNFNVEMLFQVFVNLYFDVVNKSIGKDDVDRNGVEVDQFRRIQFELDVRRNEEKRGQFVVLEFFEDEEENK